MISLDFIFAFLISFGMSAILFAMTMTLSVVEITQYITFSTARTHAAGNLDPQAQESSARQKYNKLITNPALGSFFNNGWFEISKTSALEIKGGAHENASSAGTFQQDYPSASANKRRSVGVRTQLSSNSNRPAFVGVRTQLSSKILDLKLPLVGKTDPDGEGFSTKVISMIIREPSQVECQKFISQRFEEINNLDSRFSKYNQKSKSYSMEDNGC